MPNQDKRKVKKDRAPPINCTILVPFLNSNKPIKCKDSGVPFIAKLAIAPEATLSIVVFWDDRNSRSRASRPPS